MGKREPPDTVGGNISWNDRCREQPEVPQETKNRTTV